jgi:hypothetical protein
MVSQPKDEELVFLLGPVTPQPFKNRSAIPYRRRKHMHSSLFVGYDLSIKIKEFNFLSRDNPPLLFEKISTDC